MVESVDGTSLPSGEAFSSKPDADAAMSVLNYREGMECFSTREVTIFQSFEQWHANLSSDDEEEEE